MSDPAHTLVITEDGEIVEPAEAPLAAAPGEPGTEIAIAAAADDPELPADPPEREAVVVQQAPEAPLEPTRMTLTQIGQLGRVFAQSGLFKDARDAGRAIVQIVAGQELGIGPMQSMNGIHIVDGRPALSAGLIGALVKRSGRYDYRVQQSTDEVCELEWMQAGEIVGTSAFTIDEAKRAGLVKNAWLKYPSDLLFARALSRGARRFCPDVFGGAIYAESELDS